jgi:hypothetical protein
MAKFKRFVIALLLPTNVAALILFGRQVWAAVLANVGYFAAPSPTVAAATANLDALEQAEAAIPHGGPLAVANRNLKQAVVETDLKTFKAYLLALCMLNPGLAEAMIAASCLRQGRATTRSKAFLAAKMGAAPHEVILRAKSLAKRGVSYLWQYSLDNGTTWVTIGTSTDASTIFAGATPKTAYLFRYQATIKQTTMAPSQSIPFTTP